MLSRQHPGETEFAWQGSLQTDAGLTDGTCGGALVDIHGRLLGIAALWNPGGHGRNSGIGFGVPWSRVVAALPSLQLGKSRVFDGFLGIGTKGEGGGVLRVMSVAPDSPAAKAGIEVGDAVVSLDGKDLVREVDVVLTLRRKSAGDPVRIVVERAGKRITLDATMGRRAAPTAETAPPEAPAPAAPTPDAPTPEAPDAPKPETPAPEAPAAPSPPEAPAAPQPKG
jgi:S1-C subfamily serine protease